MSAHWVKVMLMAVGLLLVCGGCSMFPFLRGDPYPRGELTDRVYRMGRPANMLKWGIAQERSREVDGALEALLDVMTDSRFSKSEQQEAAEGSLVLLNRILQDSPKIVMHPATEEMSWRTNSYLRALSQAAMRPKWESRPFVRQLYFQLEPVDTTTLFHQLWRRHAIEYVSSEMSREMWDLFELVKREDIRRIRIKGGDAGTQLLPGDPAGRK